MTSTEARPELWGVIAVLAGRGPSWKLQERSAGSATEHERETEWPGERLGSRGVRESCRSCSGSGGRFEMYIVHHAYNIQS